MRKVVPGALVSAFVLVASFEGAAAPRVGATQILAPLAGPHSTPAPGQANLQFYGTDLGWTFAHKGQIRILFGDTFTAPDFTPAVNNDAQGAFPLGFLRGAQVDAWIQAHPAPAGLPAWRRAGPPIQFITKPAAPNELSMIHVINNGVSLSMDGAHTPISAFSDGRNAFGLFERTDYIECRDTSTGASACDPKLVCDSNIGFCGGLPIKVTCAVGAPVPGPGSCFLGLPCLPTAHGVCFDPNNSANNGTTAGHAAAAVQTMQLGVAGTVAPEFYTSRGWDVSKFFNSTADTVRNFDPRNAAVETALDYQALDDQGVLAGGSGGKVFMWGRPLFLSSSLMQAQLYFLYADLPRIQADGAPSWNPRYFAGLDSSGAPRFSDHHVDAKPLDLSGGAGSPQESIDCVGQLSVSWVQALRRWVLIYGGDAPPIIFPLLSNPTAQCVPDGAMHVRFAKHPWGPWSKPQTLLSAGHPEDPNRLGLYGNGGIMFSPNCAGSGCAPSDPPTMPGQGDVGRLYAANIVDTWTESRGTGRADLYWLASTWNPYQVVLFKTRLEIDPGD
jgi:hypothetical protein